MLEAMNRRTFLKLTGLVAAGQALQTVALVGGPGPRPALAAEHQVDLASTLPAPSLTIQEPGTYRISGLVRLEAPLVEISGIANKQSISWSDGDGSASPVASFVTFERYDRPGTRPDIRVRGGRLEALAAVPLD